MRPGREVAELVLVDALEGDRVDLPPQAGGERGVDAGHDLVELAPARDGAELVGIERVERDVDALDAVTGELTGIFRQLRAVGGDGELVERAADQMAGEGADS